MNTDNLISANEFCIHYEVDSSFLNSLNEFGLVEIILMEEVQFINVSYLPRLERIINLHYELGINLEGVEAIGHLLSRIRNMQNRITDLENRLRLFESI
jgi:hypothetical protein